MNVLPSGIFLLFFSISSFQFEELPLTFLLWQVWCWEFSLVLSAGNVFISSSYLKDGFTEFSSLSGHFFPLQYHRSLSPSHLAYTVSTQKSAVSHKELLMKLFSLAALRTLPCFPGQFDYTMSCSRLDWVQSYWWSPTLLSLNSYIFP